MDVDEADDDDEYEVVGYGGAPRATVTPTRRASDANAARVPSTSARKAPVGFNWDDDLEDDEDDDGDGDGEGNDGEGPAGGSNGRALTFDLDGGAFAARGGAEDGDGDDAVDEIIDEDDAERVEATPPRRAMDASRREVTPRRSPRLLAAAREGVEEATRGKGTPSPGTAARDAEVLAEALGVSVERAAAAAKKMRASKGCDARDGAGGGGRAKSRARTKTNANGKAKANAATSPRHAAKRTKTNTSANANAAPRGVLGRLNLLTQSAAVRATGTGAVANGTNAAGLETTRVDAAANDAAANDAATVEDDIAMDDIDDDGVSSSGKSGGDDEVPCTLGQENVDAPVGLGALSRLPKMSSPTFIPRSSVGASLATQRNRSRNAGSLTNRLQHVLQNAQAAHAQFAKRVAQSQPPSARGALHFTVNASRLDASLTNCAGAICDLHRATSDDFDRTNLEYSRAIVIFTSAQAQELSLERGRQVAIYPPWREVDLPGRVDETTSNVDESVPRVILCAENVLRLN